MNKGLPIFGPPCILYGLLPATVDLGTRQIVESDVYGRVFRDTVYLY